LYRKDLDTTILVVSSQGWHDNISPVPSKDMQTHPPPSLPHSEVAIFTWKMHTAMNRKKYQIFIFWVMADSIYNLRWHTSVPPTNKKVVQKMPNLQEWCVLLWQRFFCSSVFFMRLLVFEIWSILMYVTSCMQNWPYCKN